MIKYLLILLTILLFASCNNNANNSSDTTDASDSTQVDSNTLVSDVNWGDGDGEEIIYDDPEPQKSSHSSSHSSSSGHRSGGGGGAADTDVDVVKYQSYERAGDSPRDFATALIYPAIRMVYSDNFAKPKVNVLSANKDGDRHTIDLAITWKDHWTPKYKIEGTLEVNSDGSDAKFTITNKNTEAEVLELTEDNFQSEITIPSL